MSKESQTAREIFERIIEEYRPDQWEEVADKLCAGNSTLLSQVLTLLRSYSRAEEEHFLESVPDSVLEPIRHPADTVAFTGSKTEVMPKGPYRTICRLGGGTFGSVFLAEQRTPIHREVALKVFHWSLDDDQPQLLGRFLQEQEVLALLDHPNIARIYDAGTLEDGRPYYAMELVRGAKSITRFCDDCRMSIPQRLEVFLQLCAAIHHAHQRGIIHRDLKPSNVLVTEQDGKPQVKVIDFGLAKALQRRLVEQTVATSLGVFMGTPAYAAPEQMGGDPLRIDIRADVYSLGAILYELLVGVPPLPLPACSSDLLKEIEIIRTAEPQPPSRRLLELEDAAERAQQRSTTPSGLHQQLRGDLDWIVLKCLEKEPALRYDSVGELIEEIRRYLRNDPVRAAPPTIWYRARKFAKRYQWVLAVAGAIVSALVVGIVGLASALLVAQRSAVQMQRHLRETERLRQQAEANLRDVETGFRLLATTLAEVNPRQTTDRQTLVQRLSERAEAVAHSVQRENLARTAAGREVCAVVASLLLELGKHKEAVQLLEHAIKTAELKQDPFSEAESTSPAGTPPRADLSALRLLLAVAYHYDSQIPEAFHAYLELEKDPRIRSDPFLSIGMRNNLAAAFLDLGKPSEAFVRLRRLNQELEIQPALAPLERSQVINNLALCWMEIGNFAEAAKLMEQVCQLRKKVVGDEHPYLLSAQATLAAAWLASGQTSQAIELLRSVEAEQVALLGPKHPDVLATRDWLGLALCQEGQWVEAIILLQELWQAKTEQFGREATESLGTAHNLARAYLGVGKIPEALARIDTVQTQLESQRPIVATDLALAHLLRARIEEQRKNARAAAECREKAAQLLRQVEYLHRAAPTLLDQLAKSAEAAGELTEKELWETEFRQLQDRAPWLAQGSSFGLEDAWFSRWGLELIQPSLLRTEEIPETWSTALPVAD
jgi:serine/threonine protein kinase/gas vesicle protein